MNDTTERLTIEKIVEYALKNKLSFECFSVCRDENIRWDENASFDRGESWVGLELKKDVFYWWKQSNFYDETYEPYLFFVERYNRVNGASQKTFNKEWQAVNIILNRKY